MQPDFNNPSPLTAPKTCYEFSQVYGLSLQELQMSSSMMDYEIR